MKRTKTIPLRVNDDEYSRMKSMGKEHGGVSQLIRYAVLETRQRTQGMSSRDYRLLASVNANLRTIARASGQGVDGVVVLVELCAIERLLKEKLAC